MHLSHEPTIQTLDFSAEPYPFWGGQNVAIANPRCQILAVDVQPCSAVALRPSLVVIYGFSG